MQKRKISECVLPHPYLKRLATERWCLSENTFNKSIGKITEVEPEILFWEKEKKKTTKNATAISEVQEKVGVQVDKKKGGGDEGKGKDGHTTAKGDRSKEKSGYYLYGRCNKTRKGVCQKLKNLTQQPSKQGDHEQKNG